MHWGFVSLTLSWGLFCGAATVHVDLAAPNDPGPGNAEVSDPLEDGSQAHPFDEIKEGIDAATDGDTVLVAPGEYVITEPVTYGGKAIAVRGEAGADETTIRMSGHGSVVVFNDGETQQSVLDGFTVTGGERGGVYCQGSSSPTLTSCTISGNSGSHEGGGVHCHHPESSPTLINCTIAGNLAYVGGGVRCSGSPTLTNCTVSANSAIRGGGVYCEGPSPTLANCTISGNSVFQDGGGVYCSRGSPILTNCIVWDNVGGSVLAGEESTPQVAFSCIEGVEVWLGEGNLNDDPLFCGGWETGEVVVNDQWGFEDALSSFRADYALSSSSPCLGTGEGGSNMGADKAICETAGEQERFIRLGPGTFSIEGLTLAHHVSIEGAGEYDTVINGTLYGIRTGSRLSHVTVSGGTDSGIYVAGGESPEMFNCTITGNSGGGLCCVKDSAPTLTNCTISGNDGGVYCTNCAPTLTNCTISGNGTFKGWGGAGIHSDRSSPTLTNCIVWDNAGRSIWIEGDSQEADLEVTYSCIEGEEIWSGIGNTNEDPLFCGWRGGAEVYVDCVNPDPANVVFPDIASALEAQDYSLALSVNSPCLGTGEAGSDMGARQGICDTQAQPTLVVRLAAGTYESVSGVSLVHKVSIRGSGAEETVIQGTVSGLRTGAALSDVTVTAGEGSRGGGVRIDAAQSPNIVNCRITGNLAHWGAGVYCEEDSSPTLTNCVISGNRGPIRLVCDPWGTEECYQDEHYGGGVYCSNSSPTLRNCTILGNRKSGVFCDLNSSLTLTSCIVCDDLIAADSSTVTMNYCCLLTVHVWEGEGNTNEDPLFVQRGHWEGARLDPFQYEIGGTWMDGDYHLRPDSPCIDAGRSAGAPTTDIEGYGRPCGTHVDMGAYETGACPADTQRLLRGDSNTDATLDIADAIFTLSHLFAQGPSPVCEDAADANDDGAVDISDGIFILQNLFANGPAIPPPYPECGVDPTVDELGCAGFAACE